MGFVAILVMWPASCHQIFISLYLKALNKIWFRSAQKFLRKSSLNFCIYTPSAKVKKLPSPSILTYLLYIQLDVTFFPIEKPKLPNFTLPLNMVNVTPGSSFEQTMMGWIPGCYIPSFVEIDLSVPEKIFDRFLPYRGVAAIFAMLYHIWAWWPSWSCDQHHVIRFSFPCTWKLSCKVWFRSAQ